VQQTLLTIKVVLHFECAFDWRDYLDHVCTVKCFARTERLHFQIANKGGTWYVIWTGLFITHYLTKCQNFEQYDTAILHSEGIMRGEISNKQETKWTPIQFMMDSWQTHGPIGLIELPEREKSVLPSLPYCNLCSDLCSNGGMHEWR